MAIFNSYVSLPEGTKFDSYPEWSSHVIFCEPFSFSMNPTLIA